MAVGSRQPQRQAKRTTPYQRNTYYTEGNTARRLMPQPEREYLPQQETRIRKQPVIREKTAKAINVNRGIDFITMLFLGAVLVVTVMACFRYLELQSTNKEFDKAILAGKGTLAEMTDKNNFIEAEFNQPIDFEAVYQKAVGEHGMVFPREDQVLTYKQDIYEYVWQKEALKEEKISTLLDIIFGKQQDIK